MTSRTLSAPLAQAFARQAAACRHLGSPFTAMICDGIAERGLPDSKLRDLLQSWPGDPTTDGDALPVRICGALHELVISGRDPTLASVYPPNHGAIDASFLHATVSGALERHEAFAVNCLQRAPQTNEIRRAAALYCGLMHIAKVSGKPIVLSEICASAGLNLQVDRLRYRLQGHECGAPASPVYLCPEWRSGPASRAVVRIVERRGCDLHPFDLGEESHRQRLLSYIWADQHDRLARTRSATRLALESPATVDAAHAIDWLEARLAEIRPDNAHVIWHSIAWQYLSKHERERGDRLIRQAGARSTANAPLYRLGMEGDGLGPGASLRLASWPGGAEMQLARIDFHGKWINWLADYQQS